MNKRLNKLIKEYLKNPKFLKENTSKWPKEITSRYSDEYRFELQDIKSDRAKYNIIDIESGKLKGTQLFGKPEHLISYAENLIKPQGGTQSTNLGESKTSNIDESKKPCSCGCGTCGEGEGPKLNESFKGKLTTTEVFKVHMDKSIPLTESKYPKNSKEYKNLIIEARYLYSREVIDLNKKDAKLIKEYDNDELSMRLRAAKYQYNKPIEKSKPTINPNYTPKPNNNNSLKIKALKKKREQLMMDMEQEAEPEGGPIADRYGRELDKIDRALNLLNKKTPLTYDQAIKELKTNDGFPIEQIIKFQGLNIVIENKKGTTRSGIDSDGNAWEIEMKFPYGYVRRTEGVDGDEVDVYVGDNRESDKVFIVHQNVPETGEFDEDKVMLGFDSGEEAKSAYLDHYDNPKFFGTMDEMSFTEFKERLKKNKGQQLSESTEVGNMINIARAKAHFKLGEKIVAQNKKTKEVVKITGFNQFANMPTKMWQYAYEGE